jgi:hypothetical protein
MARFRSGSSLAALLWAPRPFNGVTSGGSHDGETHLLTPRPAHIISLAFALQFAQHRLARIPNNNHHHFPQSPYTTAARNGRPPENVASMFHEFGADLSSSQISQHHRASAVPVRRFAETNQTVPA